MGKNGKRYNIGLLVGNAEDSFSNGICQGAIRASKLMDDNLFIIPMKYFSLGKESMLDPYQRYEYQYNFLANYVRQESFDILLMALSTIGSLLSAEEIDMVLKSFGDTPIMLISSDEEGYPSVKYDNKSGFMEGVRYIVENRGCRHVCVMAGPQANFDARERLEAIKEVLEDNDITLYDSQIAYGDFSGECREEMEQLLRDNPDMDALICSNDCQGVLAVNLLTKYGFKVGSDVCVMGFDDAPASLNCEPPLATVKADPAALGYRALVEGHKCLVAFDEANPDFEGVRKISGNNFVVDTSFVLRESASGTKKRSDSFDDGKRNEYESKIERIISMNHKMNNVSRDMLMNNTGDDFSYESLIRSLEIAGIPDVYLYLLNRPLINKPDEHPDIPNNLYLKAFKHGNDYTVLKRADQKVPIAELFNNDFYSDEERKTYVVIDIFSQETQYGILVCDIDYEYFHYLESLCYQISVAMKLKELFTQEKKLLEERKEMLRKLEKEYLELDDISNKDELTGILNRRGLMSKLDDFIANPANRDRKGVLLYVDLNYLKHINDQFTHAEGNFALKACADALDSISSEDGLAGRIGGDEFVCVVFEDNAGDAETIKKTVRSYINNVNDTDGKPYIISISIGVQEFIIGDCQPIKEIISKADEELYIDKGNKGPFVTR